MAQKLLDYLMVNPLYAQGSAALQQGSQTGPVATWAQGLARALQGGIGGYFQGQAVQQAKGEMNLDRDALARAMKETDPDKQLAILSERPGNADAMQSVLLGKQQLANQQQMATFNQKIKLDTGRQIASSLFGGDAGPYGGAISGIESQGQPNGGYGAIGPVADAKGSRGYGKYGIMDYNIGPWTQEVLGQPMTPQQFLQNPQAQDAVFKAKFGHLVQKYGPEGASRAWFAGEGGMNNPNASDVNGMTVQRYGQQFTQALGGAGAQPIPNATGVAQPTPIPNATPGQVQPQPAGLPQGYSMMNGLPVPTAMINTAKAAFATGDVEKGLAMMNEAYKMGAQLMANPNLQQVKGPKGENMYAPAWQAGGMEVGQQPPNAGTEAGDVAVLERGLKDPEVAKSAEYAAAYARLGATLKEGPNGQKIAPNLSMYPPPGGAPPRQGPGAGAGPGGSTLVGQPQYNESQTKEHTYVSRLNNSIPKLEALIAAGNGGTDKMPGNFAQTLSRNSYWPESFVGEGAKSYRQLTDDIISAVLRQESGSAIGEKEYAREFNKYVPQPNDSPAIIQQKMEALKTQARAMAGNTGRAISEYPNIAGMSAPPAAAAPQAPQGVPPLPPGFKVIGQ